MRILGKVGHELQAEYEQMYGEGTTFRQLKRPSGVSVLWWPGGALILLLLIWPILKLTR